MAIRSSDQLHPGNFLLHTQEHPEYDGLVLLKEPSDEGLTTSQIAQLHNEYVITRQLSDVPGVRPVYAIEGSESHPILLLEYIQGRNLSEIIQGEDLDLVQKLGLAVDIAGILGRIHAQKVMHKGICSSNILVADDGAPSEHGGVYIIDFSLATKMTQEVSKTLDTRDIPTGSLAYISPEQTGRMNRSVDYRSDLYSLGATLYELFTGQLPFQTSDTMMMIHAHIASQPVPPQQLDTEIPEPLSDIILKLLAKNPEDRYPSVNGLVSDLKQCQYQLNRRGRVESFALGEGDFSGHLQIPQKLYGRGPEIEQLLAAFDRVTQGNVELLLVAGYSGVGKTALVREIQKPIFAKRGAFIEGKYDQYQRSIPYYAWGQAFDSLVKSWLAESESELSRLKGTIVAAVGDNGRVLIDLIPNLSRIIGPQPEPPLLAGLEAQNRFNYVFQSFINAIVAPDRPLVVFLDDLQWIDLASLSLLKKLLTGLEGGNLLLIGAYRDNQVDSTHPLILGLSDIKAAGATVNQLALGNLSQEDITQLLSDSLKTQRSFCLPLSQLIHAKTAGNAFFTHQLLHVLEEDGLLNFNEVSCSWHWDMAELEKLAISDNVVDLLVNKLGRLPGTTQEILRVAACRGNLFELTLLSQVSGQPQEELQECLHVAYQEGLLDRLNGSSRFVHDRVQQAAYSLIPESDKAVLHQRIGKTLLRATPQAQDQGLFDIVGQLNLAIPVIENEAERVELARLNLKAAQDGMKGAAFAAAEIYSKTAIELLGVNGWQDQYALMLKLHQLAAEAAYLTQAYDSSLLYVDTLQAEAHSLIDQIPGINTKLRLYFAQNQADEAMDTARAAINELGFVFRDSAPTGLSIQAIAELPAMSDPTAIAALELLEQLLPPVYTARFEQFPRLVYTAMDHMLKFGVHPGCSTVLVFYAVFLWAEDIEAAYQYGELSMQLVEKFDTKIHQVRVKLLFTAFIRSWKTHYRDLLGELLTCVQMGFEYGEKAFAAAAVSWHSYITCLAGHQLDQIQGTLVKNMALQDKIDEAHAAYNVRIWAQFAANLRGLADDPLELEGRYFSHTKTKSDSQAAVLTAPISFTHSLILVLHYHLGEYSSAYANANVVDPLVPNLTGHVVLSLFTFYQSLTILQLLDAQDQHPGLNEKLEHNLAKIRLWAGHAPMNQRHNLDLLLAEKARLDGNVAEAIDRYEAAITGAKDNQYIREQALANELYGRFWLQRGNDSLARPHIREAHALYNRWGAMAIVEYLEAQYPQWLKAKTIDTGPLPSLIDTSRTFHDLDINSVLKASRAITSEIELKDLLFNLMNITMENAGAQRGYLILEQEGQLRIAAQAELGEIEPHVEISMPVAESDLLSHGIVHYVARTQQVVLLEDASQSDEFADDPYLQGNEVKSLLCTPLVDQGEISAILYLENNLSSGVFTTERVKLLNLLSSQMAISIDNARIHKQLEELLQERTGALSSAEEQIRALFQTSTLGVAMTTYDGQFLSVNRALVNMLRTTEADLLQRRVSEVYVDLQQRAILLDRLRESGNLQDYTIHLLRDDGSTFFARLNSVQLLERGREVFMVIVDDVTEQMMAEQEAAVREERDRLARDLHDSVTQGIYSANLIAETLPVIWEGDPAEGRRGLRQLERLTQGALAEMRALLLELRPANLTAQELPDLVRQLVDAMMARTHTKVTITVVGDCMMPDEVKIAFYRIAQEALNNMVKYAEANRAEVNLQDDGSQISLRIRDDGCGFDPQVLQLPGLGIGIMRERASEIDATLNITSQPDEGTQVLVAWQVSKQE